MGILCTKFLFPLLLVTGVCRKAKDESVESMTACTFLNEDFFQGNKMENCLLF